MKEESPHSLIFSSIYILVKLVVNPEPIPEALSVSGEFIKEYITEHHAHTHIHTRVKFRKPIHLMGGRRKWENWDETHMANGRTCGRIEPVTLEL